VIPAYSSQSERHLTLSPKTRLEMKTLPDERCNRVVANSEGQSRSRCERCCEEQGPQVG